MKTILKRIVKWSAVILAAFLVAATAFYFYATRTVHWSEQVVESDIVPTYAVGFASNYVRAPGQDFDPWGRTYKSDEYRILLDRIEATGTPRTVYTNVYYPAAMGTGKAAGRAATTVPAALPAAASGRQVTTLETFANSETAAALGLLDGPLDGVYQAYVGAEIADGSFPLIVMVHGLGGTVTTWASQAEYLAAQGYVVVTLALTSDASGTPVFDDPASPFGQSLTPAERAELYAKVTDEGSDAVFQGFFYNLYGLEDFDLMAKGYPDVGDMSRLHPTQDGAIASGRMMAALFEQRTQDVANVINEMKILGGPAEQCQLQLAFNGVTKDLCGFFQGHIDLDHIGVMGQSLGSMTAQSAAAFLEDVDTAVGVNNGMPRMWEPWGGLPGEDEDGLPMGQQKPFLQIIGDSDFFVHMVFRGIHWELFEEAGGDPGWNYPLPSEQPWPTADNPQPVALSAFERATGPKMMLTFRDEGHDSTTDDIPSAFHPGQARFGLRVPTTRSNFTATRPYVQLGWVKAGDMDVFMPHLMRNYYVSNWFDWTLKGDEAARDRLHVNPFESGVRSARSSGV